MNQERPQQNNTTDNAAPEKQKTTSDQKSAPKSTQYESLQSLVKPAQSEQVNESAPQETQPQKAEQHQPETKAEAKADTKPEIKPADKSENKQEKPTKQETAEPPKAVQTAQATQPAASTGKQTNMKTQQPSQAPSSPPSSQKPAQKPSALPPEAKDKGNSSFLMMNIMTIFSFVIAIAALVLAIVIWMSIDKVDRRVEDRLIGVNNTITDAQTSAKSAKEMAQQSFDKYNEAAGKISFTASQIASLGEQTSRIDALSREIKSIKTLDGDLFGALEIAELQSQLVGSAEPILFTLKAIDERLQRQGQSSQSPLRRAIAQDMELISSVNAPDILSISNTLSILLDESDQWRLVIDAPTEKDFAADKTTPTSSSAVESGIEQEVKAAKSQENIFKRSWQWTSDKAADLGHATWNELSSMVRITPIKNPDAVLMSPEQGVILRENVKLRLLNLRLSLLQRQYETAQVELTQLLGVLDKYYVTTDENVAAAIEKLTKMQAQARAVEVPAPEATKAALALIDQQHRD